MTDEKKGPPKRTRRRPVVVASPDDTAVSFKTVAVFGGSGFVGRNLIRRLTESGVNVVVASRHPASVDVDDVRRGNGTVKPVQASILSADSVRTAVDGVDAVINLVGILQESGSQTFDAIHVDGARRVAEASRDAGVGRLVHMSALGADANASSAYARSKALGERRVCEVLPETTILRPSIIFGPEDDFFNRFAAMAKYAPALPLIGGGDTRFQPVYVGDVTEAITRFLTDDTTKGKTYELCGPKIYTFKDLLQLILKQKGMTRALIPIPFVVAEIQGTILQMLPNAPLTRDQVESLKQDNVFSGTCPGFADLKIAPTRVEDVIPTYL
jgi:NADH dehydrogenase